VIDESAYWKDDLLKRSSLLRRYIVQKRWPGASFAKCEQTVMIGFYSIRKLIEAKKLTDVLIRTSVSIRRYPPKGKPVTRINRHKVDELYDLDEPEEQNLPLMELCHQFVHSYIFTPVLTEQGGLFAIWVASDRQRSRSLLEVGAKTIINIFENIGKDEVRSVRMKFDVTNGDYSIENI
jgi:hypothetical protein